MQKTRTSMRMSKKNLVALLLGAAIGALCVAVVWAQEEEPAYIVAQINIHDTDRYSKYGAEFGPIFVRHQGEGVAFSGVKPMVLEGEWDYNRTVVVRFPSEEAALAWYNDPDYQRIAKHRWAASDANIILIGR